MSTWFNHQTKNQKLVRHHEHKMIKFYSVFSRLEMPLFIFCVFPVNDSLKLKNKHGRHLDNEREKNSTAFCRIFIWIFLCCSIKKRIYGFTGFLVWGNISKRWSFSLLRGLNWYISCDVCLPLNEKHSKIAQNLFVESHEAYFLWFSYIL